MQFRTKARAVDLLGKGQIADLPTAITELWKNGYDAYAENVSADVYLDTYQDVTSPMFIISDDGLGMSNDDILEKWLVLGTDSKSRSNVDQTPSSKTLWKKPRIKAGEKGIGRLSVAYLGNPMLMLTKKQGYPLQAVFFDWRILENYNLFLDDVNIPMQEIEDINDFSQIVEELKIKFLENFNQEFDSSNNSIWEDSQLNLKNKIENSVENVKIPLFLQNQIIEEYQNIEDSHGTKFIIFEPIDQMLNLDMTDEDNSVEQRNVISSVCGFTNEFIKSDKIIKTSITYYKNVNCKENLLKTRGNFFVPEDFEDADIIIDGVFDGKGKFVGRIKLYDNDFFDYEFYNPRKIDLRSDYGEIPMKLGYNMGVENSSKLDSLVYNKLRTKVDDYGGLYIYRDNFRVLPYGKPDADFLQFEERRSKRAGTYFFSYRRMFGYLGISREKNVSLIDKSSREGLINNASYRAMRSDMIMFFITLAQDFFATEAKHSIFFDQKESIKNQNRAISLDQKRASAEKRIFTMALKKYPERLLEYETKYKQLLTILEEKTNQVDIVYIDIEDLLDQIQSLDIEYDTLIPKITRRYKPTEMQMDRLAKYETQLFHFKESIDPLKDTLFSKVQEKLQIRDLKINFEKKYNMYSAELSHIISLNRGSLKDNFKKLSNEYQARSQNIIKELNFHKGDIIASIDSKEKVIENEIKIENKFESLKEQILKELIPLVEHVKRLTFDIDEDLVQGAYKAEYESIKYKWEQTRDTAQLGIVVEIIDHEFNQLYARINSTLDHLSINDEISEIDQFKFLKQNFNQLEEKYDLLSPLYRLSGAVSKDISCKKLVDYIQNFFRNTFTSNEIEIETTQAFMNHKIFIKEPVIHTVIINVINNAIYWMRNKSKRVIKLDYLEETKEIIICNSGLKIEDHRIEKIFEMFYSNRPNGRGIGLYLAKQSLNDCGYDIYATNEKKYNALNGACFIIKALN